VGALLEALLQAWQTRGLPPSFVDAPSAAPSQSTAIYDHHEAPGTIPLRLTAAPARGRWVLAGAMCGRPVAAPAPCAPHLVTPHRAHAPRCRAAAQPRRFQWGGPPACLPLLALPSLPPPALHALPCRSSLADAACPVPYDRSLSACVQRAGLKVTSACIAVGGAPLAPGTVHGRAVPSIATLFLLLAAWTALTPSNPLLAASCEQAAGQDVTSSFTNGALSLTFFAPDDKTFQKIAEAQQTTVNALVNTPGWCDRVSCGQPTSSRSSMHQYWKCTRPLVLCRC